MALPANEDTRLNYQNYVRRDNCDHMAFIADGDKEAGQLVVIDTVGVNGDEFFCGVCDTDTDDGDEGTLQVTEGIEIRTNRVFAGSTFAIVGGQVWYNNTTGNYYDTEAAGLYWVGKVLPNGTLNASGVFGFEKHRYAILSDLT